MEKHSPTQIVTYHAGGRGLTVGLMLPRQFHGDSFHVLFEADVAASRAMQQPGAAELAALGPHAVHPYCLGAKRSRGRLHVTADSFASSNLEPEPAMAACYAPIWLGTRAYDVAYRDTLAVREVLEVEIFPLDELFEQGLLGDAPAPDFFSLDTQGSELGILQGAGRLVEGKVLGIATEFELVPVYRQQPLFPELFAYLTQRGFLFCGFLSLQEISRFRAPPGARGNALPAFGDALFLRSPESIAALARSDAHHFLLLHKLAFIAVHFGHLEYALGLLQRAGGLQPDAGLLHELRQRSYFEFLQEFQRVVGDLPKTFPPLFTPVAASGTAPAGLRTRLSTWLKAPGAVRQRLARAAFHLRDLLRPFRRAWRTAPVAHTALEKLLMRSGFTFLVPLLRRKGAGPAE